MPKQSLLDAIVFQDNSQEFLKKISTQELIDFHNQSTPMMVVLKRKKNTAELKTTLKTFHVHPLIFNDIFNENQRAKIEIIDDSIFCVLSFLDSDIEKIQFKSNKISLLIEKNLVLVITPETYDLDLGDVTKHFSSFVHAPRLDTCLFYFFQEILNQVFDEMDSNINELDEIEELLISNPKKINLKDLYFLRRNFLMLRKILLPLVDAVDLLSKFKSSFLHDDTQLYFINMYKQVNRTLQSLDFYQHMVSNIHDIYMSNVNNFMNRSIAMITKFATIFIPITFITGIFGMNFENPLFQNPKGFTLTIGAMGILSIIMALFFRSKKFDIDVK
jgi:magnesium transporter